MEHECLTLGCYLSCLLGIESSQKKLAQKLRVTPQTVNNWIHDRRRPDKDTLLKLCLILRGVPEKAFQLAGYEIDPLAKSWYVEMQIESTPVHDEYLHMKRQLKYLRQIMKCTDLQVAADYALDLIEILRMDAQKDSSFLPLQFEALDNLVHLYLNTCTFDDMEQKLKPVIKEMRQIQQEMNDDACLGILLCREGLALPFYHLKRSFELKESLKLLKRATRLIKDPNRLIETLWHSCLSLGRLGNAAQFDHAANIMESKVTELSSKLDINQVWLGYEKLAVANALMWERFHEKRYLTKSRTMFKKAKVIYDIVHRNGDYNAAMDLNLERDELRLAFCQIIEMTPEEKLHKAKKVLIKSKKLGDPKSVLKMQEYIASKGEIIPDSVGIL